MLQKTEGAQKLKEIKIKKIAYQSYEEMYPTILEKLKETIETKRYEK